MKEAIRQFIISIPSIYLPDVVDCLEKVYEDRGEKCPFYTSEDFLYDDMWGDIDQVICDLQRIKNKLP